jgi:hypothetical protein
VKSAPFLPIHFGFAILSPPYFYFVILILGFFSSSEAELCRLFMASSHVLVVMGTTSLLPRIAASLTLLRLPLLTLW